MTECFTCPRCGTVPLFPDEDEDREVVQCPKCLRSVALFPDTKEKEKVTLDDVAVEE